MCVWEDEGWYQMMKWYQMNEPRYEKMQNQFNRGKYEWNVMKNEKMEQNQYESVGFGKLKWKGYNLI